jgi:hypothetical protein
VFQLDSRRYRRRQPPTADNNVATGVSGLIQTGRFDGTN